MRNCTQHTYKQAPVLLETADLGSGQGLLFLDFLSKVCHAVGGFIKYMQEQSYKNKGGIYSQL